MTATTQFRRASWLARLLQLEMTADALLVKGIAAVTRHAGLRRVTGAAGALDTDTGRGVMTGNAIDACVVVMEKPYLTCLGLDQ